MSLELAHCEILAALHAEAFGESWSVKAFQDLVGLSASYGYLAQVGEEPVGFILCQGDEVEAEIITIATRRLQRRTGIGTKLLEHACQQTGRMFLEVDEENDGAISFYQARDFHQIGLRTGYYKHPDGRKTDALVMERTKI
ncbi:GNAT family N-acetyltransferase [Terasakiella sp. SH-1]|uniref:GNAT family N-acetyltransferase n=1 Tax=Terasakiella sp. SH-1 TaxID=2560057 RepID=UPI001431DC1A|nr:GNAT family N-acetyltransferase [Terasakiella sp. SH-1]